MPAALAYLLAHVLRFESSVRAHEETLETVELFPWVGVYPHPLARLITLTSLIVLPAASLFLLSSQLTGVSMGLSVGCAMTGFAALVVGTRASNTLLEVQSCLPGSDALRVPRSRVRALAVANGVVGLSAILGFGDLLGFGPGQSGVPPSERVLSAPQVAALDGRNGEFAGNVFRVILANTSPVTLTEITVEVSWYASQVGGDPERTDELSLALRPEFTGLPGEESTFDSDPVEAATAGMIYSWDVTGAKGF